jgi:tartrate dehydrogenase/decarboxylase / D-malate dehydrogenase
MARLPTSLDRLQHLGEQDAAAAVMKAIEHSLSDVKSRTQDLGGHATTQEVGKAIAGAID